MYLEIPQGKSINIQGLNCWIPKEGYVYNQFTKSYEHRGIHTRNGCAKEQYWERFQLPLWYKDVLKREDEYLRRKKEDDAPFYDERYEKYKQQEWDRRLNGFWLMVFNPHTQKEEPIYLTGFYYTLLQWFSIDIGYAKFTIPHLYKTYFLDYCIADPLCMGMIDVTKRRFLKTFIGGLFVLDYTTRTKMVNGALQSKTGNDAKKVFSKAVVYPFRKFPRFFRPEYDMSLGINPKTEIRFQQTNIRGKKAEDNLDKDELGSIIDWGSADAIHYDGSKIHRYFSDEWGKTTEANVYDRHEVVRYCLLDEEGNVIGKALYSTTVEKLETDREGIQEAAKQLWAASNQNSREDNGRTQSGLYRFFQTSDECRNFDIYGYPNVEKTIKDILADRKTVEHNQRLLFGRIRKEPRTIDEAFSVDADKCIFNSFNIANRKKYLEENPIHKRGIWFYRDEDTQAVKFRDITDKERNFHWRVSPDCPLVEADKIHIENQYRKPTKIKAGAIGIDGYSNSQGGQRWGSRACGWIGIRNGRRKKVVGMIYGRPNEKDTLHEQVLLAAEYLGFQAYYEHNSDDYYSYFKLRGRLNYLGAYPIILIDPIKLEETTRHKGSPTTPYSLTKQTDLGKSYFENDCDEIDYEELLEDAETFDPNDRTKSDITVSFLITNAVLTEVPIEQPPRKKPLIQVFNNRGELIEN